MTDAPISRPLKAADVPDDGLTVAIVADEAERAAIAAANETISVEAFRATVEVRAFRRDGLEVWGRVEAEATRTCVVTLEPFAERVSEDFEVRFTPDGGGVGKETDAEDPPERLVGGEIDLGAIVAEFFTLGLNPHPRKPGAEFRLPAESDGAGSPFAALRSLKNDGGE